MSSEKEPRASVTRIVDRKVPTVEDSPTRRNVPEAVVPVRVIFEFVGELVTVTANEPVPPLNPNIGDVKATPRVVSIREIPTSVGGGETTTVIGSAVVAPSASVAVTVRLYVPGFAVDKTLSVA
jgi:hypothetical protein